MNEANSGSGLVDNVREMASVVSGSPTATWKAAQRGTEKVASILPNAMGLDHVRHFIRQHPVVSTAVMLGMAYFFLGGSLFGRQRWV